MTNDKFFFSCINCGTLYPGDSVKYLCDHCSKDNNTTTPPKGVLKALYQYEALRKKQLGKALFNHLSERGFIDLLPIKSLSSLSPLSVGHTPMYHFNGEDILNKAPNADIYFKNDALNPTYSLKDRASDLVSAYALENNITTIVAASTGNAGSSIAGICASQKQKAIVMVPAEAPVAKLLQIMHYGAQIVPVKGTYDQAFDLSIQVSDKFGFYNRNTAYNPLTIEGKKTVAFEIFEDLNAQTPDYLFVSAGDGVIVSGVYKGFEDLLKLGILKKMPHIVAVQSEKSQNIAANINKLLFKIIPATTLADSISVDVPRNFYMTEGFLSGYKGDIILVSDEDIQKASLELSKKTGIFAEPAATAAFAGMKKYHSKKALQGKIIVLITGNGLKDLKNVAQQHKMPNAIEPNLDSYIKYLEMKTN